MILVDTAIWIDHLRREDMVLSALLDGGEVLTHPFIVGELAMGQLRRRAEVIDAVTALPLARVAEDDEVLLLIEQAQLFGRGLGYIDAHLLAASRLTPETFLWTRDKRLDQAARELSVAATKFFH